MLRLLMSFLFVLCTTICLQGCATERSSHATAGSKDAIVMDVLGPWRASRWGSYELPYAGNASIDTKDKDADPTFTVHDPSALHVWVRYGFLVDYNRYPIFVLRYRAHNLATDAWYNIWMDDSTGPAMAGVVVVSMDELKPDGEVHEIRKDLRLLKPNRGGTLDPNAELHGPIVGMALGIMSNENPPGTFELLDLRFEAED